VQGKVLVNAAKASDEVVFESSDGTLSGVAAVGARGDELVVNFFFLHEIL
jgi:hypothetical protein